MANGFWNAQFWPTSFWALFWQIAEIPPPEPLEADIIWVRVSMPEAKYIRISDVAHPRVIPSGHHDIRRKIQWM